MFDSTANHSVWLIWIPGNIKNLLKKIKDCYVGHLCLFAFFQISVQLPRLHPNTQDTRYLRRLNSWGFGLAMGQELPTHVLLPHIYLPSA